MNKELFDKIPLAERKWVVDEGKWLMHELWYDEKNDTINCDVTDISGDLYDSFDYTEEAKEQWGNEI